MMSNRIVMSLLGYAASSLAVGFTIVAEMLVLASTRGELSQTSIREVIGFGLMLSAVVSAVAWVPAIGFMIYGARTKVRSILYYVAVGLISGLFFFCAAYAIGLFEESDESIAPLATVRMMQMMLVMFLLPGTSAGLTYWAIAGRRAGRSAN